VPEATSFRITTYHKLAKDEAGITQLSSERVPASVAISWVLDELPEDAVTISNDGAYEVISIDWSLVPRSIRSPKLPARRR
jgi:hypothetical protein